MEPPQLDSLDVDCPHGAAATLARVRAVLEIVLGRPEAGWPSAYEWGQLLPAWFVAACVDDVELRDCVVDRWSLRGWIYWLHPERRRWRWWDATADGTRLTVRLEVLERPYLRGALEWLLQVAAQSSA
ncbi:MAG: hypothetical protein M3024_03165 [Candidatus Dormibacteraeota bacterium]|nr:hypothetical protein [Candidatus Dormibacteraeota bacterium]